MSTVQGGQGNIVTNGLVLNLDAANPRSYPQPYNGTTWQNIAPVSSSLTGSLVNGVGYTGSNGGALTFDGVDDYVNCGVVNAINNSTSSFSIDIWLYSNSIASEQMVFSVTNSPFINSTGYHIEIYQSKPILQIYPSTQYFQTTSTLSSNTWYNIVASYNSGSLTWYKNGNIDALQTYSSNPAPSTGSLYIGAWTYNTLYKFRGRIPSIKYYPRSLSASEVLQNFNATRARFGV
jgi:hypothetical protein